MTVFLLILGYLIMWFITGSLNQIVFKFKGPSSYGPYPDDRLCYFFLSFLFWPVFLPVDLFVLVAGAELEVGLIFLITSQTG